MKSIKLFIINRISSFNFAINGLKIVLIEESNLRIHIIAAITIVFAGFLFEISNIEWVLVSIAIGFVITTEIINTTIENYCDLITNNFHPKIKKIKDMAAASVLICSMVSLFIGLVIFIPRLLALFKS